MNTSYKRVVVERPRFEYKETVDFDPKTCRIPKRGDFKKIAEVFHKQIKQS